ncbi:MAG: hypothetical protein DME92_03325 [Verrucomicrobia bacterium]|nr:MAG: hypothetical protein DME92_03325 [Verrucomicrobiota bacterium]
MKLPRDLSGWKVVNGLRRLGFTPDNQKLSHLAHQRPTESNGSESSDYPAENAESILRQAEITIDELMSVIYTRQIARNVWFRAPWKFPESSLTRINVLRVTLLGSGRSRSNLLVQIPSSA